MSNLKSCVNSLTHKGAKSRADLLRKFGRNEEGSIIVLTLLLLVMMLVLGGMAVDFMRFESRRVQLQSVSDRAVLAAAKLDQSLDSREVVIDYFEKAGFGNTIVGEPDVNFANGRRSVSVDAEIDVNTFYLKYVGINELAAPASAAAVEGVGTVEISLILDVSGSMETSFNSGGTSKTQIQALREAATSFVDRVITPDTEGQVTLSLVPYSEHVNIGPALFNRLTTSNGVGTVGEITTDPVTGAVVVGGGNPATCVEIPNSEYTKTAFDLSLTYEQTRSWQSNSWGTGGFTNNGVDVPNNRDITISELDQPLCPDEVAERIIPVSDNEDEINDAIADLEPTGGTSIFLGMKWGVTLLDPSFASVIGAIPNNSVFPGGAPLSNYSDSRPVAYAADDPNVNSAKYIVLMTDGKNSDSYRIQNDVWEDGENTELFNTFNYPFMWYCANGGVTAGNGASAAAIAECNLANSTNRFEEFESRWIPGVGWENYTAIINRFRNNTPLYTPATGNSRLDEICTAAKARNIIVFTIALNADADGEAEMKKCASRVDSELYYFEASGNNLTAIFNTIADQITALRLSL